MVVVMRHLRWSRRRRKLPRARSTPRSKGVGSTESEIAVTALSDHRTVEGLASSFFEAAVCALPRSVGVTGIEPVTSRV